MGSIDRTRKRNNLWRKAIGHFALCFVMGFFTGFAPPSTATLFSGHAAERFPGRSIAILPSAPSEAVERVIEPGVAVNRSLTEIPRSIPSRTVGGNEGGDVPPPAPMGASARDPEFPPRRLLIVVTTTQSKDRFQGAFLRRLAHTLRLVPPPLLWIVVQAHADTPATAAMLRNTGVMYRHLTFKENFTDPEAEADHQRNVALSHVEYHRLTGIVHFAAASSVYDLQFFDEIREIEVFGSWPVAMLSENRKRLVVDGPVCHSSKVEGWILKDLSCDKRLYLTSTDVSTKPPKINIYGFAFNSSILWDPERWGRPTSLPDTSQDSIKFVHEVILEDVTKLKGIPADCSKIMVWHLYIPRNQDKKVVVFSRVPCVTRGIQCMFINEGVLTQSQVTSLSNISNDVPGYFVVGVSIHVRGPRDTKREDVFINQLRDGISGHTMRTQNINQLKRSDCKDV